jgi:hypothetical protein
MTTAERTILVAAVAGAIAIGTYLLQHSRAGDLEWRRHIWPVLGMAAGLAAFVSALLIAPAFIAILVIPALALVAGIYLLRNASSNARAIAGWALIAAGVAGFLGQALRLAVEAANR